MTTSRLGRGGQFTVSLMHGLGQMTLDIWTMSTKACPVVSK
jgi:hypothetical protein